MQVNKFLDNVLGLLVEDKISVSENKDDFFDMQKVITDIHFGFGDSSVRSFLKIELKQQNYIISIYEQKKYLITIPESEKTEIKHIVKCLFDHSVKKINCYKQNCLTYSLQNLLQGKM